MSIKLSGLYSLNGQIKQRDIAVLPPLGTLLWTLDNPDPYNIYQDNFGNSVATDGIHTIIGAYRAYTGLAYIFDTVTGALVHTLYNPNPYGTNTNDNYGISVAISGNHAIVGAYTENDAGGTGSGKAYIYDVTTGALLHTLDNPNAYGTSTDDHFGYSVSISDNYAIVGAYNEDHTNGSNSGKAYIFDVTTGSLLWTLNNPTPASGDYFGWSVSISGNRAIVGAYSDNTSANDAGSAYIYDVTTGTLLRTLTGSVSGSVFGYSVSISGNYAVVGAPYETVGTATQAGKAYIYNVTTGALLHTLNNPTPAAVDLFGHSVSISGNYAIVGAYLDDTGASSAGSAYIYDVTTGALLRTLNNPTPAVSDNFGWSVAISGSYAIVGAIREDAATATDTGAAYSFNVTTGSLLHTLNNPQSYGSSYYDHFGRTVAISGNYAIVGAYHEDDPGVAGSGKAYIYDVTTGSLLHTLNNPTPAQSDHFGWSVAIDGNYAIVGAMYDDTGASNAGSAYIYDVTTGSLLRTLNNPAPALNDNFGYSVSISGNYAVVGAPYETVGTATQAGKAYIFNVTTGAFLRTLTNPNVYGTGNNDYFGYSVSISGIYAIVGAHGEDDASGTNSGKAYIYNVTTGALLHTLNNPTPAQNDSFGFSVAISGNYAIVGASGDDPASIIDAGSAYIYDVTTGALLRTINNPTPAQNDRFGYSVSISGNYAIVGSPFKDDAGGTSSGKAYIFNVTTGKALYMLDNPNAYGTSTDDYFGFSVSISGNNVIVGAYQEDDAGGTTSGKAYIFNQQL